MTKEISHPYFFTWAKQLGSPHFEMLGAEPFYLKTNYGKLLEFSSLSYQASFGLRNKKIEKAIANQLNSFPIASTKSHFKLKEEVSNLLLERLPKGRMFYTLSGAESVENALKVSRLLKDSSKVASLKQSYHGASLGALSVGGDWRTEAAKYTYKQGTLRLPPSTGQDCATKLEDFFKKLKPPLAAVIIETVTGGNGCFTHDQKWLDVLSKYHKKLGFFLILDEVICGFGRLGRLFGYTQYSQLKPDIICFSKAITGGFVPFGAVWFSEEISKHFDHHVLPCGLTNYAHPLGLAATKAVLKILTPSFLNSLGSKIQLLKKDLQKIHELKTVKEVRQEGMFIAIDLYRPISIETFWENKLSVVTTLAGKRIVLAPFLNSPKPLLKEGLAKVHDILETRLK